MSFLDQLGLIKRDNKVRLAELIARRTGVALSPDSLFDVQVKRLHEYKRQLMNCLHVVARYQAIKDAPGGEWVPRSFIFGGKAAPGYAMAKLHIKLINDVARVINADPAVGELMRVVFVPNYNVSFAERIIPAADLSEQISMAGKEASGTGNMKFAMNGALTIGTLDGANIEIREAVGAENFFLFGHDAGAVKALKASGYRPGDFLARSPRLQAALELVASGFFSPDDRSRFAPVVSSVRNHDPYLICADFEDYWRAHAEVDETYAEPVDWQGRVVMNLANIGRFSSDRTIRQYAAEIWGAQPCVVTVESNGR
jgi:glycogen phosphorylase